MLTERGIRVVAPERGPWRKRESFGGDELANVNRYNLWPDPILNPQGLPVGPSWADEKRLIMTASGDQPRDIRDHAILLLHPTQERGGKSEKLLRPKYHPNGLMTPKTPKRLPAF